MKMQPIIQAAIAAAALTTAGTAQAGGGSFSCERASMVEVGQQLGGSFGFQKVANQYLIRWDAKEARRQCENYAAGRPYTISCLNGRRDWNEIKASIPAEYFGKSNQSLAEVYQEEIERGNSYKEAMAYCRSVGAIR